MIRVYGFYSCGGYKDMYLGSSERCDRPSYYLPLLPVMKERQRPEDLPKIERQEKLEQIRLVTRGDSMGFPDECDAMFSHGGYVAMYRILSDGSTCLAMRDIPSMEVDEVGRNIPFNLLLIATDEAGIAQLDRMAVSVKDHYVEWRDFATSLFTYDPDVNGVRFDLPALFRRLADLSETGDIQIDHARNTLVFLMLAGVANVRIAMREQNLQPSAVRCILDVQGQVLQGHFPVIDSVESDEPRKPDPPVRQEEPEDPDPKKNVTTEPEEEALESKEEKRKPEELEQLILMLKAKVEQLTEEVRALRECKQDSDASKNKQDDAERAGKEQKKASLLDAFLPEKYTQYKEDYLLIGVIIVILLLIF
mgnify:CR=1 FL=1